MSEKITSINVACVLWGTKYTADKVTRLYEQVHRNLTVPFNFCVFTEQNRVISDLFTHYNLQTLNTNRGWWHKISIFNSAALQGPTLYLDLDVIISGSLDWTLGLSTHNLTAIRDFKTIWQSECRDFNSSMMWFDNRFTGWYYEKFISESSSAMTKYYGDQDWLTAVTPVAQRRFFDSHRAASYRWQCIHGGWDPETQQYKNLRAPITGNGASVIVFHGEPKPWDISLQDQQLLERSW